MANSVFFSFAARCRVKTGAPPQQLRAQAPRDRKKSFPVEADVR
jgi:hypothetical protein